MKKLLITCLTLFMQLLCGSEITTAEIIEERNELFILCTLSYLHVNAQNPIQVGYDIASILAWDVEDIDHVPDFIIDCNRTFEKQGSIFHAEMMVIESALEHTQTNNSKDSPESHYNKVKKRLDKTTLYSSLEPCPYCIMGISWAYVPKVIYFMEDPAIRDGDTYMPLIPFPKEYFFGRQLTTMMPSSLAYAKEINQDLRKIALQRPKHDYVFETKEGKKVVDLIHYFEEKKIFKTAYEQFLSYEVKFSQNQQLFKNLHDALHCAVK